MAQPIIDVDKLRTAEQDGIDENSGAANKIEPPDYVKDTGERSGDEPPVNWFNYWKNVAWQWIHYIVKGTITTPDNYRVTGLVDDMQNTSGHLLLSVNNGDFVYCGNNILVYQSTVDFKLYRKSIYNDDGTINTDPGTAITSYIVNTYTRYCGNNIIVFRKGAKLYKKSILFIDNETQLTTYDVQAYISYVGNNKVVFQKTSDSKIYIKDIGVLDTESNLTTTQGRPLCGIGNNQFLFLDNTSYLFRKSISDVDNITQLTSNYTVSFAQYIGNDEIIMRTNKDDYLYIKSAYNAEKESIISNITGTAIYIGNGEIAFKPYSGQYLYIRSIKDFS
jgi:hypothetical protein